MVSATHNRITNFSSRFIRSGCIHSVRGENMYYTDKIERIVMAVLSQDVTSYRLAKDLGYSNNSTISKMRRGETSIRGLSLEKLAAFEEYYRNKMEG